MKIDIIGVPLDFGAGRRGVDMGPSAIRLAGLREGLRSLGHEVRDLGDVAVPLRDNLTPGDPQVRFLDPILPVLQTLHKHVASSVGQGHVTCTIGGDHSLCLGSASGAARHKRLGYLHLDTHPDFNSLETTPSGNIHGMPVAALCGLGHPRLTTLDGLLEGPAPLDPSKVVIVGAREIDEGEKKNLLDLGVRVFSMSDIDRHGMYKVMCRALEIVTDGTDGLYASFDLDVVDPMFAPGVGTPAAGGIDIREAHLAMEMIAATQKLVGLDLVEVNPILDQKNMTAELAVELALSAFGKVVWAAQCLD